MEDPLKEDITGQRGGEKKIREDEHASDGWKDKTIEAF